ncbi:hypothetical protein SDC9_110474 [bioreactor metagenome]|uniref:Uncharacterized protein n=1 Tax=bioreactor metagenome TaxID=1076179 RepID=A0A645BK45_9ZZZZ
MPPVGGKIIMAHGIVVLENMSDNYYISGVTVGPVIFIGE